MRSDSSFVACRYRAFFPQFHGNFHWMTWHGLWIGNELFLLIFFGKIDWTMRSHSSFVACRYRAFFWQFHGNFHCKMTSHALWAVCRYRAFFDFFWNDSLKNEIRLFIHGMSVSSFFSQFHGNCWKMISHGLWTVCRYRAFFYIFMERFIEKWDHTLHSWHVGIELFFRNFMEISIAKWHRMLCGWYVGNELFLLIILWKDSMKNEITLFIHGM